MDIEPVGTITIVRPCGILPCGQCENCRRKVMLNASAHILEKEQGGHGAALRELLDCLGLI